jgi:hypothetical protein
MTTWFALCRVYSVYLQYQLFFGPAHPISNTSIFEYRVAFRFNLYYLNQTCVHFQGDYVEELAES